MTEIDTDGSDGSFIAKSNADGVGVFREEAAETDAAEHIATVVEADHAQSFFDGKGDAHFRVDDEKLSPAFWHLDAGAIFWIGGVTANGDRSLWTGPLTPPNTGAA